VASNGAATAATHESHYADDTLEGGHEHATTTAVFDDVSIAPETLRDSADAADSREATAAAAATADVGDDRLVELELFAIPDFDPPAERGPSSFLRGVQPGLRAWRERGQRLSKRVAELFGRA
jgi:hypothetical protein